MKMAYEQMSNYNLGYEIEFLLYENGRIARGHAQEVEIALNRCIKEMKKRGFDNWRQMVVSI